MELKKLTTETLEIFGLRSVDALPDALLEAATKNDTGKYKRFADLVGDLAIDWLQKIFQYYEADRKERKQDFTPTTLARLASMLISDERAKTVLDICAGSGALTIQKWVLNKSLKFVCVEIDRKAMSVLVFNLALRNISAIVINGDALTGEIFEAYELKSSDRFSQVSKAGIETIPKCDVAISNPPFNMKWAAEGDKYLGYDCPPKGNANYAFILRALEHIRFKAAIILPNGVLTAESKAELSIRRSLIENNLIESVILCPDKMFEATSISTCIVAIDKEKTDSNVTMVDMRESYTVEQREQNGQYGGASHENRTYKKEVKTFSGAQIGKALENISEQINEDGYSRAVSLKDIRQNNYSLQPSKYIKFVAKEFVHRSYEDIAQDINRLERDKSILKITLNETLAKKLGFDIELYKQEVENAKKLEQTFAAVDCTYKHRKYIQFSKKKNEFRVENQDDELLSSILGIFLPMWKQHIVYLNEAQNVFLAEFRDALLNDLLSGKKELED